MNAKDELIELLCNIRNKGGNYTIKCAAIDYYKNYKLIESIVLKMNYTNEDYEDFIKKLNFDYSDSNFAEGLDGYVWLEDGTWIERIEINAGEVNGFYEWKHSSIPKIPDKCKI